MLPLPSQRGNLFLLSEQHMYQNKRKLLELSLITKEEEKQKKKQICDHINYLRLLILDISGLIPKDQKKCTHESHDRFHFPR